MALESIPDIRTFLESFAKSSKWNESTANRLTAVAKEALLTLLNHNDELDDDSRRQHLLLTVRKDGGSAIVEVIAAHDKDNLEDCIGLISEHNDDVSVEREVSLRILRHYASSVQHEHYHDIDIITITVDSQR